MMNIVTNNIKEAMGITHDGIFHPGDIMATIVLSKVFSEFKVARVATLTEEITEDHIIYDMEKCNNSNCRTNGIPYATCGEVFKKYGHKLFKGVENPEIAFELLDRRLISIIDADEVGSYSRENYESQKCPDQYVLLMLIKHFNTNKDGFVKALHLANTFFESELKLCCELASDPSVAKATLTS